MDVADEARNNCNLQIPSSSLTVDHSLPVPEMKPSLVRLCKDLFPKWSNLDESHFFAERVSGAITNLSLAKYIKKHACSNAKTEDLWGVVEEESGEPVNKLMNSWTKQKGYPVVSARLIDNKLEFEQSQFLASGCHGDGQWVVPITLCCGSYEEKKNFLLETKSQTIDTATLFGCSVSNDGPSSCWIKINIDQAGFYGVKYDEHLSAKLRYAIESKSLSAMDRYGILDDSFALSMAGQLPLSSLITLMGAYREEPEYTVLSNLISISSKVARIVADADATLLDNIKIFFILFKYSAERLCKDLFPKWSNLDESHFFAERVSGGITNLLLKVSVNEQNGNMVHMTVKLYGPNTEYVINRERELQVNPSDVIILEGILIFS